MHWLGRHRLLVLSAICLFWTGLVLVLHWTPDLPFVSAVWSGEKRFEDFLEREGRKTPTRDDFVFLGIDQSTLQMPPPPFLAAVCRVRDPGYRKNQTRSKV
jgi:hypothetical protein